jgi:hypothetical protein
MLQADAPRDEYSGHGWSSAWKARAGDKQGLELDGSKTLPAWWSGVEPGMARLLYVFAPPAPSATAHAGQPAQGERTGRRAREVALGPEPPQRLRPEPKGHMEPGPGPMALS